VRRRGQVEQDQRFEGERDDAGEDVPEGEA
jgi:hypothetical protein